MVLDFYIELSSNTVKGRYVVLKKKNSLFKGKKKLNMVKSPG